MNFIQKGATALITGASTGLGKVFAEELAAEGSHLVLVARSQDKLEALAADLRRQFHVNVTVLPADLTSPEAVERLLADIATRGLPVQLLINNAGSGVFENFLDAPAEALLKQIDLNVRSLVALTRTLAPAMVAAKTGGIINIASTAAFQAMPGANIYAASKSFVLLFSEALAVELEKSNVHVLAACPGPVATEFFADKNPKLSARQMDQPQAIVREILDAYRQGKRLVIPGKFSNRLLVFGERFLPRSLIVRMATGFASRLNAK